MVRMGGTDQGTDLGPKIVEHAGRVTISETHLDAHATWREQEECGAQLDLSGADLRGADLSGANLRGADLSGADLRGADLRGADLSGAVLSDAVLRDAVLSHAVLSHADLSHADLSHADLSHADLSHADLNHADLRGAKGFEDATIDWGTAPSSILLPDGWHYYGAVGVGPRNRELLVLAHAEHGARWRQGGWAENLPIAECSPEQLRESLNRKKGGDWTMVQEADWLADVALVCARLGRDLGDGADA